MVKKQGYKKVDKSGIKVLLWKPFIADAVPPNWVRQVKKPPARANPGKITVTAFTNGYCPVQNVVLERAKRAAAELGNKVVFQEINTFDRDVFLKWGIFEGFYIEDKEIGSGPPLTYEKI
ncbi:hypothetical protein [Candidatus Contubernalis alkaliaceticus]|uniref:hypothetical protein n=1 Tax=Candidatus Contubernalis alkaliaceticus TaxID=338645 RepID=UPI001F4BFFC7|nr:hypothetical protein [Candidatus Contubernalis alkalaceticus]UNC92466.1 hypothetical protein HUE98_10380 [Candidatus Contubernalis alkalaceticus]